MHVPGSRMVQSDALSRQPDHISEEDTDNEDLVLLSDKLFINLVNIELAKMIELATTSDELVKNMSNVHSMKGVPLIKLNLSNWKIENGMLFYQDQCYIPDNNAIQNTIVQEIHKSLITGHPGRDTTLEMVQRYYWWPRLCNFIYKYVAGCATCEQNKVNTHPMQLPTQPIKYMARKPFQMITQDFISGLPKTKKGYDCIMVM